MARRGGDVEALAQAALGLALPAPGHAALARDVAALWVQPRGWLLVSEDLALPARAKPLAAVAALVEQSHGRAGFRLAGPAARAVLAKGCRIDLHPRVFGVGRVASTVIAHGNALLHQVGPEAFEIFVFSTLADHMADWLEAARAEFGYPARGCRLRKSATSSSSITKRTPGCFSMWPISRSSI